MNNEITLKLPKGKYSNVRGTGISFCHSAFRQVVDIPEDLRTCVLVATVEVTDDSYPITRPKQGRWQTRRVSNLRRIKGNTLYPRTGITLAQLYDAGYRAVQIEYTA